VKKTDIGSKILREISHYRKGARDVSLLNESVRDLSILGVREYMKIHS
jgi:hypothetical protein